MINRTKIEKVSPISTDFLYLIDKLYKKDEKKYTSQPQKQHLVGCYVYKVDNCVVGRFALYMNPKLLINNQTTLQLGSYECINDSDISKKLFLSIIELAKFYRVKFIVGPIEGATWHNYRFSVDSQVPLFFTEVKHQNYYLNQFKKAGFNVLKSYSSTIDNSIKVDSERLLKFGEKFTKEDVIIRNIDLNNFENELHRIGKFCNSTFDKNYFFSPLRVSDFAQKYLQIKPFIVKDLFYIVENRIGDIQAFMFCIPNYLDPYKQSVIVKSMATLPKRHLAGLQIYLGELMYAKAIDLGYTKAIHAYMIDDNMSKGLSKKFNAKMYQTHQLLALEI